MKTTNINVNTKDKNYSIKVGSNLISKTGALIENKLFGVKKVAIVCDNNLPLKLLNKVKKSVKKYDVSIFRLPAGEKQKNIKTAEFLITRLLKQDFNRSDCVIALGGGVIGDLAAFVASITKRGVKFVNIPTTLLAQVDASVGGKTAVNSNYGKNLIGSFYQPDLVISDVSTLNSLPLREIICGYAEILKHSIILDRKFFFWLSKKGRKIIYEKNKKFLQLAIVKSCKIKSLIVKKDEKERNLRMILNFGHTFGHAFEATKNFSKKINHGEAVLLGMITASNFAYKNKILTLNELSIIKKLYMNLGLPMNLKKYFKKNDFKKIIFYMKKDKKNSSEKIKLILIKKIGSCYNPTQFSSSKINDFLKKTLS